jgi:rare lipoprotein A (peptidoglycan hydrolase)
MSLLLPFPGTLRHKHRKNVRYACASSLLLSLITLALFPEPALAFEAGLSHSSAQALVAPVRLAVAQENTAAFISPHLPTYSYRASGIVTASGPITTETGDWQPATRLAQASAPQTVQQESSEPIVLEGEASYYSRGGCLGCSPLLTMANGKPLDDDALTMAIGADKKHLVGRRATVTNLITGQAVDVLITDTGGFYQARYGHRVADLTIATKQAIGMAGGVGQVRVEVY